MFDGLKGLSLGSMRAGEVGFFAATCEFGGEGFWGSMGDRVQK